MPRRTVYRDENGKLTSYALPHQFVVLHQEFKDNEPCVGGMNKVSPKGKGGILCAPGDTFIAANTL